MCRNVTIYFDTDTTRKIVSRLHQALNPEGWLIVGHSEPQPGVYDDFTTRNFKNATCYQKPSPALASMENESRALPVAPVNMTPLAVMPASPPVSKLRQPIPAPKPPPPSVVTAEPADEALWLQAQTAANAGNWDEAVELLAVLEHRSIMKPQVHYLRALIQQHTEDWAGALASLRQSIYCDPTFVMAYYMLGDLHARRGALKDATRYWRQAQNLIEDWAGDHPLVDDLNVDMLRDLLAYRLGAARRD